MVRRGDHYGIDVLAVEDLSEVVMTIRLPVLIGDLETAAEIRPVDVAERGDVDATGRECMADVAAPHSSRADVAERDALVGVADSGDGGRCPGC